MSNEYVDDYDDTDSFDFLIEVGLKARTAKKHHIDFWMDMMQRKYAEHCYNWIAAQRPDLVGLPLEWALPLIVGSEKDG